MEKIHIVVCLCAIVVLIYYIKHKESMVVDGESNHLSYYNGFKYPDLTQDQIDYIYRTQIAPDYGITLKAPSKPQNLHNTHIDNWQKTHKMGPTITTLYPTPKNTEFQFSGNFCNPSTDFNGNLYCDKYNF